MLNNFGKPVIDSSTRWGYFLFQADSVEELQKYLPQIQNKELNFFINTLFVDVIVKDVYFSDNKYDM